MKHRHCSWSIVGGNHLAKILAKKHMGRLYEVTEQMKVPLFEKEKVESILAELTGEILRPRDIPEMIGKGYEYPKAGWLPMLGSALTGDGHKRFAMAGF